MLANEAAAYLAGVTSEDDSQAYSPTNVHLITGTVVGDSANGHVKVLITGITFSENDTQYIELDSVGGFKDGDKATILLSGEPGHAMTPLALGGVGVIDRVVNQVDNVEEQTGIITDTIVAESGRIDTLVSDNVVVNQKLVANQADIQTLYANDVNISGSLIAANASIDNLQASKADITDLQATNANVDSLRANKAEIIDLEATNANVASLRALKADINAANIDNATIVQAWIDRLMVQSNLISHEGTIYTLDAIQVNANNITAGTLDVDRLIVTVNGEKYLVNIDPTTSEPSYQKLDGGVIEDLTITADKIVAGAITAEKITTENIVGSGGWINLRNGTFLYSNAITGDGIGWDGQHLYIGPAAVIAGYTAEEVAGAANELHYDCTYIETTKTINDSTVDVYIFTAKVTRGGTDVTSQFPEEAFVWYVKDETSGTTQKSADAGTGGRQFTFIKSEAEYRATVIGGIADYLEYDLVTSSGDNLRTSTSASEYIGSRVVWEV